MVDADLTMRFAVSADRLWSALTGAELVPVLLQTYASNIAIEGGALGEGAILVTTLQGGGIVRERIESIDPAQRRFEYQVLDAGPLPYANYRGESCVQPIDLSTAEVTLRCRFVAVGTTEAAAKQYWIDHNTKVLNALRAAIEPR